MLPRTSSFFFLLPLMGLIHSFSEVRADAAFVDGDHVHFDHACTKDDKKYLIKVYAHMDKGVIDSIKSMYARVAKDHGSGRQAVSSYLGTIIDSYNDYIDRLKVEIDLDLNAFDVNDFLVTKGFDHSCEIADPVVARTKAAHDYLLETYKDKIGIHLFIWSCPFRSDNMAYEVVIGESDKCGRSTGVIWDGSDKTVDYVKSVITEAITGKKGLFSGGAPPNLEDLSGVCLHADRCIIGAPSANGVLIYGREGFRNTVPGSIGEGVFIPPEENADVPQRIVYNDAASNSHDNDCMY